MYRAEVIDQLSGHLDEKFFLEDLLGRRIDLVTETALRAELRDAVLAEAIPVA